MSFFDDLKKVLLTFLGLLADAAKVSGEYITHYYHFLKRMFKLYLLYIFALPLVVVLPALLFQMPWNGLYSGYAALLGLGAVCLTALAFPLIFFVELIFEKVPGFKENIYKTARHIADVGFWAAMIAIYFYVVPVWKNPSALPLVILTLIALALAVATGRVTVNPRLVQIIRTVQLFSLLVLSVLAFAYPTAVEQLLAVLPEQDIPIARILGLREPKPIKVTSAADIQFKQLDSGKNIVWYYFSPDGRYELFDGKGYHRSGPALRLAKTEQEQTAITAYFRGRESAQQEANQEMRREDEAGTKSKKDAADKALAEAKAKAKAELEAKTQADAKTRKEGEAKAKREAKARADGELKAKAQAEAKAKAEAEAKAKAEAAAHDEARRKAVTEAERIAAETRRATQNKYLWPLGTSDAAKLPRLAVVVVWQNQPEADLTEAVSRMASRSGYSALNQLFKDEFISDGSFDKAFKAGLDSLSDLALTNRCEYLALCQLNMTVPSLPAANSLQVVAGKFQIKLFNSTTGALLSSQEYNAEAKKFDAAKAIPLVHVQLLDILATNSLPRSVNHK